MTCFFSFYQAVSLFVYTIFFITKHRTCYFQNASDVYFWQIVCYSIYLCFQRVKYFTDLNNLLEWVLYVSSALFVTPVLFGYGDHLNTEAGAIAIFLAWFNCLLFLQRLVKLYARINFYWQLEKYTITFNVVTCIQMHGYKKRNYDQL